MTNKTAHLFFAEGCQKVASGGGVGVGVGGENVTNPVINSSSPKKAISNCLSRAVINHPIKAEVNGAPRAEGINTIGRVVGGVDESLLESASRSYERTEQGSG